MYEMLTGKLPFNGHSEFEVIDGIRAGTYHGLDRDIYPKWACDIVKGLLVVNPNDRIQSCGEILNVYQLKKVLVTLLLKT